MKANSLKIISADLLSVYLEEVPKNLQQRFEALQDAEISTDHFSFYISVSSVYSSKIEGGEIFVKIHPWTDGNGRSVRLLEKWFLSEKLGEKAWFVQSEKMYYQQHQSYYTNIRLLGLEYIELDYSKALPFLLMLPHSLSN